MRNAILVSLILHVLVIGLVLPATEAPGTGEQAQVTHVAIVGGAAARPPAAAVPALTARPVGIAPVEALPPPPAVPPGVALATPPPATVAPGAAAAAAAPPYVPTSPLDKLRNEYMVALSRHLLESPVRYPREAWDSGIEGTTIVTFTIDQAGNVTRAGVAQSSGSPLLDGAAVRTIERLSPLPAPPRELQVEGLEWDWPVQFSRQ